MQVLVSSNWFDEAFAILAVVHGNPSLLKGSYAMHHMLFNALKKVNDKRKDQVYSAIQKFGIQPLSAEAICFINGKEFR